MEQNVRKRTTFSAGSAVALCLLLLPIASNAQTASARQRRNSRAAIVAKDKRTVAAFEERVKQYVKLREGLEGKLPNLSKDSTPEQIQAHKTAFQEKVRAARVGAKQGDLFTPDIARHIRATMKTEFKDKDKVELRETVLEADTKGVPLRVNYPYPETKELVEMPPTLLLKLPPLPKQVKYRFVGRNMLLVDRENGLIIDYMTDALP